MISFLNWISARIWFRYVPRYRLIMPWPFFFSTFIVLYFRSFLAYVTVDILYFLPQFIYFKILFRLASNGHLPMHQWTFDVCRLFFSFACGRTPQRRTSHMSELSLRNKQDIMLPQSSRWEDIVRITSFVYILQRNVRASLSWRASTQRMSRKTC